MTVAAAPRRGPWHVVALVILLAAGLWLAWRLSAIITPVLVALGLSYMLNPIVTWCERRGLGRVWAILGIYVVFYGALVFLLVFGIPAIVRQGADFVDEFVAGEPLTHDENGNGRADAKDTYEDLNGNGRWDGPRLSTVLEWSGRRLAQITGEKDPAAALRSLRARLSGREGDIARSALRAAATILTAATVTFSGVLAVIGYVVLVPVYMFFMLRGMDELWRRVRDAIPPAHRDRAVATLGRIHRANAAFFRGQVTISLIEGALVTVVLMALDVRFALLFGALYAVASVIPYVGVSLMFATTTLFVFVDAGRLSTTLYLVIALFVFIQLLEGLVLQPMILGRETGLHPVAIMLAIFIFGNLFGFLGVLLAVPLASATVILAQDYLWPFLRSYYDEKPA